MSPIAIRAFDVSDWGFVRFSGLDAKSFLQGLVTADLRTLAPTQMLTACVLTPKGMVVADCELYEETSESVLAAMRPSAVSGFLKTFDLKIMLSKSSMRRLSVSAWLVIGEDFSSGLPWPRLSKPARLLIGSAPPEGIGAMASEEFHALRIASGFPWYGADLDETTLALEVRQDSAISLDKGCYMGQETVSRLARVGHVNRRLAGLRFIGGTPKVGDVLARSGRSTGRVTSVAGDIGLGMLRIEDEAPGTALEAGGIRTEVISMPWPTPLLRASRT